MPEPPRQHAAWRADPSIPTNIVSAVQTLFEQGFPDPRGCEYRELEVEVSGVWEAKSSLVKTCGWVLPGKKSNAPRFATCWNGLIYPATNIAGTPDLRAELTNHASRADGWLNNAAGEQQTVLFSRALSTRVLLLLRCGEAEAALKNWSSNSRMRGSRRAAGDGRGDSDDPYLEFAGDWAWALFDRTICTHMRGDEALALATARQLAALQPKVEAEAARRGFPRQPHFGSPNAGKERPYLDFLEQLPALLADLERRGTEAGRIRLPESERQKLPDRSSRISGLIRDLDLVQARQCGQPG